MPRPLIIRTERLPYHVYARSNNRDWFYLPTAEMWEIFSQKLRKIVVDFGIKIHAFVLMSNHFHALLTTPAKNLDEVMLYLMREVAREVNRRTGRINHVFGGPYKWSLIEHRIYYYHALKYVYQNPVKAGICKRVEEYPYSSLRFLHSNDIQLFPIEPCEFERESVLDLTLSQKLFELNHLYTPDERELLRRALRFSRFKVRSRNLRRTTRLSLGLN